MASNVDKMRLPRYKDRRYKLSESDIRSIIYLRACGYTISDLARSYGVSINTIRGYIYPDEKAKALERNRYYDNNVRPRRSKDYYSTYARELRAYKKEIFNEKCY